jgi:(E)-4-hydroxy-3-methylbut-2-enyl-diphosphate synthase
VPIIGDFHYNGHILLKKYPECARRWPSTGSIPATSTSAKARRQLPHMIEAAIDTASPVRIGVNWGSLDQALLTELMDENSRRSPEPKDANEVMREAIVVSALRSAEAAESYGLPHDRSS